METLAQRGGARAGERPQAPLRLYLLGRFEAVRDGTPIAVDAWRLRRPADLLKLVALAPGRSLSRDVAIATLWPDKDAASGANNLHHALYDLRRILGGRWVEIERGELNLRGDVWVDVDAFEQAVLQGGREGWTQAVALYRGDLAPEDLGAGWLEARRRALRARFVEAALPLARAAAAEGDAQLALPLLRRIAEADPALEEAHGLLVRLGTGDARGLDGARRAARRLLGTSDPAPVRGRGPMLLLLESFVEEGSGAVVLLGEAGVGKTRLALEAARLAEARGAAVLCGAAGAPGVPYGLFADALGGAIAGEEVGAALDRVEAALRALGGDRPIFLLLDDLHAADEASLRLLQALACRARDLRLMVVATVSEEAIRAGTPIQAALAHLDCGRLTRGVRVPRLSLAGTREQIADLSGGRVDEETVAEIHRATDGIPLLVEQRVGARRARRSGRARVTTGA